MTESALPCPAQAAPETPTPTSPPRLQTPVLPLAALASAALTACSGGGDGNNTSNTPTPTPTPSPTPGPTPSPTPAPPPGQNLTQIHGIDRTAAARFLSQASTGGGQADLENVQIEGFEAWIEKQFALTRTVPSLFEWMRERGFESNGLEILGGDTAAADDAIWRSFIISHDTLRQRVAFALSQILVVGKAGLSGSYPAFALAGFMDILMDHAFGNYRDLLEAVSRNPVMAQYLTFAGNRKSINGSLPDENYAREILQLFSIGLVELNPNGTPKLESGKPIETYDTEDVMGLARVFTGWVVDMSQSPNKPYTAPNGTPGIAPGNAEYRRLPLTQNPAFYETGEKKFLGKTIPAGTTADASLKQALDIIFNHPNVGPFIGRQLIQRLVKSNPSAAYVGRVTVAFNTGRFGRFGGGKRGDMKAVISAILLDTEARAVSASATGDKVREPVLRLTHWARAFNLTSTSGNWRIGNISSKVTALGQSAMRAPSVFNFFRPGYVPPNTRLASLKLTAPEFQITDDVSVAGYLNYLQTIIPYGLREAGSANACKADYSPLLPLVNTPETLVAQVDLVLTGGRLPPAKEILIADAISQIPATTEEGKMKRIHAAVMLIMASSEFLVLN